AAVVVGQRAVIHHLQQDVEDVWVRLLDLVHQQNAVRMLGDRLGELPALVEADVPGRRADQARNRVPLHVLGHVEAQQLDAETERQLAGDLGLAYTGRTREQEVADRLARIAQARSRHPDRRDQRVDRQILAEDDILQIPVERLQRVAVVGAHALGRNARDLGDDLLDLRLVDHFLLSGLRQDLLRGTGFVDDVDRLVGQMPVVDEARGELGRGRQCSRRIFDAVMLLEARLQALQDLDRLGNRRLGHVDLLEAPRQRMILFEDHAVLVIRGRAYALERAGRQRGLQQVRRVERAARGRSRADDRMDLVDEQDRPRIFSQLLEHGLQPLLEVAAVLRPGEERAHVERVDDEILEHLRNVAVVDAARESLGDRGLADAGFPDQQRIVLAPAAQDLDDALQLVLAPDQRVDLAGLGQMIEVDRVRVERAGRLLLAFGIFLRRLLLFLALLRRLGDAVGDIVDDV